MGDGKINFTLKGNSHPQQPWLVIGADSAEELVQTLQSFGVNVEEYLNAVGATAQNVATQVAVNNLAEGGLAPSVTEHAMQTPVAAPAQAPNNVVPMNQYQQPQAPPAQAAPQYVQQVPAAPQGDEKTVCKHGYRERKEGTNKFGKPYVAYFCPTPRGTPDQCKAIFEDN